MKITTVYQLEKDDLPSVFLREAYSRCINFDRVKFDDKGNSIKHKENPPEIKALNLLFHGEFTDETLKTALRHLQATADRALAAHKTSMAPDDIKQAAQNLSERIEEFREFIGRPIESLEL